MSCIPVNPVRIESADGHSAAVVLSGHTDAVRCIRWSPDSKRVVTGGDDWQARVWNSDGSGVPLVLSEHTQPVVLDVRESWEVARCSLPGSVHIPMREIPVRFEALDSPTHYEMGAYVPALSRALAWVSTQWTLARAKP